MRNRSLGGALVLAAVLVIAVPPFARGQEPAGRPMARNLAEMKLEPVPGMPACAPGAVLSGDPTKGPSVIIGKLAAGCSIPWHYPTPNEHLMMISGVARIEMKDGEPITLHAGGFALMPSRHVHQSRCTTACTLYVYSDAAYDIHYVDAQGKEIPAGEALKAVPKPSPTATKTK